MKIINCEQGSPEWFLARCGIPTASEFDALLTPLFKLRTGQTPETFLNKKLAEAWQGHPLPGFGSFATEQGQILEDEARPWVEMFTGRTALKVGFITTDDGLAGCSPDGWFDDDGTGLEIKCPFAETHVGYLREGVVPEPYRAQVHGSMWVTGAPAWTFVSYRRGFPNLVLKVERDEKIQAVIGVALHDFRASFKREFAALVERNGGPPRRELPPQAAVAKPTEPEYLDIIP